MTPWTLRIQAAGRPPLEDWLVTQIMQGRGPFHFDVIRAGDVLPMAELARGAGELSLPRPVTARTLGDALRRIHAIPRRKNFERSWIIRNETEARMKPQGYWETVFRMIDLVGVSATIETPHKRREQYMRDRGLNPETAAGTVGKVVNHPAVPDWY